MSAALISALGAVGSTVAGSLLNRESVDSANQQNYRNWIKQQQYNSPDKQVQRLRAAGINPAIALQNGAIDSGNMQSQAPDANYPTYDFSPVAHGITESAGLYQAKRLQDAQIRNFDASSVNQEIRNRTQLLRDIAEFTKMANDASKSEQERENFRWLAEIAKKDYENYDTRFSAEIDLQKAKKNFEDAHADLLSAQAETQKIINRFEPDKQKILLANLEKQGKEIESAIRRNDAEAANNAAMAALNKAKEEGVQIDNATQQELAGSVVSEQLYKEDEQYWKAESAAKRYTEGIVGDNLPSYSGIDGEVRYYNNKRSSGSFRFMYKDKDGKFQFGFRPRKK